MKSLSGWPSKDVPIVPALQHLSLCWIEMGLLLPAGLHAGLQHVGIS